MDELLQQVLDAHGGQANWSTVTGLTAKLSLGGPFWRARGWPDVYADQTVHADTHHESITFAPYPRPGHSSRYDVAGGATTREELQILDADGTPVERRTNPRASFPPYTAAVPWDAIQTAYFTSVATWNYLMAPFLFVMPGVQAREIDPWDEDGETWRRLAVTFPDTLPNHNPHQVFFYDDQLRQRRMDYLPDVTGAPIAHYTDDPRRFDGFLFYAHRSVYLRRPDGTADTSLALITIDTSSVRVERSRA